MKPVDYLIIAFAVVSTTILIFLPGRRRIIRFAESLVGQEELSGNMGFKSEKLQRLMEEVGWQRGDQWCVFFAKMVWYNMAPDRLKPLILKKVSGNSQDTLRAVAEDKSGAFRYSRVPKRGDIAIWQYFENGKPEWKGHAGIVTDAGMNDFETIEGNTTVSGSREGYIINKKTRAYGFDVDNGLRLKGFLSIA